MRYVPSNILATTLTDLVSFVQREFRRIADAFANPELYWTGVCQPGVVGKAGSVSPTFSTVTGSIKEWLFGASTEDEMHFALCLPPDYEPYTDFYFSITWASNGTNVGTVRWGIEYTMQNVAGGAMPAATTLYVEDTSSGVALDPQMAFSTVVTGSTLRNGALVPFRLFRNGGHANDTLTDGAFMFRIGLHYQTRTPGMETLTTKRVLI